MRASIRGCRYPKAPHRSHVESSLKAQGSSIAIVLLSLNALLSFLGPASRNEEDQLEQWWGGVSSVVLIALVINRGSIIKDGNRVRSALRDSLSRPLADRFLLAVFRGSRRLRQFRHRIFRGREPKWMGDVYGLISYVNFIGLLPTFASIASSPEHFFARVRANRLPQSTVHELIEFLIPVLEADYSPRRDAARDVMIALVEGAGPKIGRADLEVLAALSYTRRVEKKWVACEIYDTIEHGVDCVQLRQLAKQQWRER